MQYIIYDISLLCKSVINNHKKWAATLIRQKKNEHLTNRKSKKRKITKHTFG